jgi:hypothetical protein
MEEGGQAYNAFEQLIPPIRRGVVAVVIFPLAAIPQDYFAH